MLTAMRKGLLILMVVFGVLSLPAPADAHPLGNFTVNRYARVEPAGSVIRVTYVLDQAEIPTFQEQDAIDAGKDQFAQSRSSEIASNLRLVVDGQPLQLQRKDYLLSEPTGQGGLPVMRLAIVYEAPAPASGALHDATFTDANQPDRIGWREIIVKPAGNAQLPQSSAPGKDLTDELRSYPADLIQAPLDLRSATFRFDPGTITTPAEHLTSPADGPTRQDSGFSSLIRKAHLTFGAVILLVLVAFGFGAVHGLAPGHGKSVMAAYLVGTKGRPIDAVMLGVLVALMHTGSVIVIGVLLLKVASSSDIANVYPVLTLLSGLLVVSLGIGLLITRLRSYRRSRSIIDLSDQEHPHPHPHEHDHADDHSHDHHDHHSHDHDHHHHEPDTDVKTLARTEVHSHGFGSHTHELPTDVAPLSRKGIIILATSGGLLPSPSAVIVLISAVVTGRIALGIGLIASFSIGLAATLTAIGLALVYGRSFLDRRAGTGGSNIVRVLPIASAIALTGAGLVVLLDGLHSLN